ncbi:hypothetical protein GCM10012285_03310 [Streptomyces kronopolitis]|uniref:Uncharacterized protein n=1 Tax=Streptomyces kronopolitis TaxID=1612435 RepID=A0ABQ2IYL4_9ACTN|nr:hypothetical protein GCM10012285_03310 [Streptomyces kronopolitis]
MRGVKSDLFSVRGRSKQDRRARPATGDPGPCDRLREDVNAIFYQDRTGWQQRLLPPDSPAWPAVFCYFGLRQEGNRLDRRIQELLRCQVRDKASPPTTRHRASATTSPTPPPHGSTEPRCRWRQPRH